MATATVTFSGLRGSNIVANHTGVQVTGGHLSRSVTLSPSGRLKMWQMPHGSTILDFYLRIQQGSVSQNFKMGTSFTRSGIMSITTLSATLSLSSSAALNVLVYDLALDPKVLRSGGTRGAVDGTTDLLPVKISLSDDVSPKSVWVIGTLGAGISASAYLTGMMFYTMDGMAGRATIR